MKGMCDVKDPDTEPILEKSAVEQKIQTMYAVTDWDSSGSKVSEAVDKTRMRGLLRTRLSTVRNRFENDLRQLANMMDVRNMRSDDAKRMIEGAVAEVSRVASLLKEDTGEKDVDPNKLLNDEFDACRRRLAELSAAKFHQGGFSNSDAQGFETTRNTLIEVCTVWKLDSTW